MNEDQRKWLLDLQEKGVKFEICSACDSGCWIRKGIWDFIFDSSFYRIPAQPIPDIPGWRELCREMQSNDVLFSHQNSDGIWVKSHFHEFAANEVRDRYQIPQQPLPEWREEMTEETKPDPREEIPHREQQIQWHEDMLHHLRTGEPMRKWECRYEPGPWIEFGSAEKPTWQKSHKYRRKHRTVTYWHCAVMFDGLNSEVITGYCKDEVSDQNKRCKKAYPDAKFSPITETTVEIED